MDIIHKNTHNSLHLGDNVYHLDYLKKIINKNPEYTFTHYCNTVYHNQLYPILRGYEDKIELKSLSNIPLDSINCWIGSENWYYGTWLSSIEKLPLYHDKMYIAWYTHLENKYDMPNPILTSEDFLLDFNGLNEYNISKEYDVLVINSIAQSGQYEYEEDLFLKFCDIMSNNGLNVITTYKLASFECTQEYNYDITDIAKISTKSKYILAVNTGPLALCINKLTIDNSILMHVLDHFSGFSYKNCTWSKKLKDVDLNF